MNLISDIATLRRYVRISATSSEEIVLPEFDMPEQKFLVPILTQATYDALITNITVEAWAKLLSFSRAFIAPIAVYYDLPFLQATVTDTGMKVLHSETMTNAPKWM